MGKKKAKHLEAHGKKVLLTNHAKERLRHRGINEDVLLEVIRNPAIECPYSSGFNQKLIKTTKSGRITVIVDADEETIKVITAYIQEQNKQRTIVKPTLNIDHEADAAYLRFSNYKVASSKELLDGILVIDLDKNGILAGLEITSIRGLRRLSMKQKIEIERNLKSVSNDVFPAIQHAYKDIAVEYSIFSSFLQASGQMTESLPQ